MSTPAPPQLGQAAAHIEIRKEGEVTVLALMGRLRGPLPSSERDKVLAAVEPGGQLVLDFSRTEDVSGASMRRILMLVRYIRGLGGSVTARGASDQLRSIAEASGFLDLGNHNAPAPLSIAQPAPRTRIDV